MRSIYIFQHSLTLKIYLLVTDVLNRWLKTLISIARISFRIGSALSFHCAQVISSKIKPITEIYQVKKNWSISFHSRKIGQILSNNFLSLTCPAIRLIDLIWIHSLCHHQFADVFNQALSVCLNNEWPDMYACTCYLSYNFIQFLSRLQVYWLSLVLSISNNIEVYHTAKVKNVKSLIRFVVHKNRRKY